MPYSNQQIADYYDHTEPHYTAHWNLANSHALHYGFWDETTKHFSEALNRINVILSEKARIKSSDRVLDAGCGVGGSSFWLAANVNCHCTGLTLSEKQAERANRNSLEKGLSEQSRFVVGDMTDAPFPDASFDVFWAIESVCHVADKHQLLKEAYRLLKPGGRLIIADFYQTKEQLPAKEQELLDRWVNGWAVPDLSTPSSFEIGLQQAGFTTYEMQNISPHIIPSAKRLYYRFFPGWVIAKLYNAIYGVRRPVINMANVWTAYDQYIALKKGLWQYHIATAIKSD